MAERIARCKFCLGPVPDDAPLSLCAEHFAKAWEFWDEICKSRLAVQTVNGPAVDTRPIEEQRTYLESAHRRWVEMTEQRAAKLTVELGEDADKDTPDSVVYYLKFGDRIKIGFSTNLDNRLVALPHDELLATEPGGRLLEARRHLQFKEHRITGEWFKPAPDLLAHIEQLRAAEAEYLAVVDDFMLGPPEFRPNIFR